MAAATQRVNPPEAPKPCPMTTNVSQQRQPKSKARGVGRPIIAVAKVRRYSKLLSASVDSPPVARQAGARSVTPSETILAQIRARLIDHLLPPLEVVAVGVEFIHRAGDHREERGLLFGKDRAHVHVDHQTGDDRSDRDKVHDAPPKPRPWC